MKRTRRYIVSGIVQGVGYRHFVLRRARELGLSGWVRNRADGTVEVHAEGGDGDLALLEADLRAGPRHARVRDVLATDGAAPEGVEGFVVR